MSDLDRALVALIRAGFPPFAAPAETPTRSDWDWAQLVQRAQRENLAALFYVALKHSQRLAELPRALAEQLRLMYLRADIASWQAVRVVEDLLAQFERANVPVVLLKGAALGVVLYPDPSLRQLGDLDILVHEQDKARAAALLQANGFAPLLDFVDGFREELGSEQCYTRRGKQAATVDLHWHVINVPSHARQTSVDWFWARTMEASFGKRRAAVLNWDAQLLHLAEHFVIHHQMRGLLWSCDVALLLALHADELDWDEIINAARQFQVLPALNAVLAHVDDVWGVTAPSPLRAQLAESANGLAGRIAVIVSTAERTEALILREGLSYRSWRHRASYFFHFFFPSPVYMRTRYRISHSALIPFFYLVRLGLGARRLVGSISSIFRNARKLARRTRQSET